MSQKLSKSDTTPEMEERDAEARASLLSKKSPHFTVGTRVQWEGTGGVIISVLTCQCGKEHQGITVDWDDGYKSVIMPKALNRNGVGGCE